MTSVEIILASIALVVMIIGLIFSLIPPLPGTVMIWAASAFYGLAVGWDQLGWPTFGVLTLLMVLGVGLDIAAGHFGAKLGGASWWSVLGGIVTALILTIVASFIGTPIFGCLAGIVGFLLGMVGVEWYRTRDWEHIYNAISGYIAGNVVGLIVKLICSVLMILIFVWRIMS